MQKLSFSTLVLGTLVLASAQLSLAVAHEDHKMECNETGMNAIQAGLVAFHCHKSHHTMNAMRAQDKDLHRRSAERALKRARPRGPDRHGHGHQRHG